MMLPPKSARKAVRRGSAKTLTSLSHTYASLMSAWITDSPSSKELKTGLSAQASSFRNDLAAVALQLQNLKETARWARWEGNVRGHWPYEEYNRLVDVQEEMVAVLAQVSRISIFGPFPLMIPKSSQVRSQKLTTNGDQVSYITAKSSTRTSFVPLLMGLSSLCTTLTSFQISDVLSVFSLVAMSLRIGEPMHTVLPQSLLDRLLYHDVAAYSTPTPMTADVDHRRELRSLNYLFHATAVIDVLHITEVRVVLSKDKNGHLSTNLYSYWMSCTASRATCAVRCHLRALSSGKMSINERMRQLRRLDLVLRDTRSIFICEITTSLVRLFLDPHDDTQFIHIV